MKKSILLAAIFLISYLAKAQNELLVQSGEKGLFLNHTVVAGENFYSVGRLFNTTAKEIAAYNQLDMNKGLMIGQVLRIPLGKGNFTQLKTNGRAVYYLVGPGEGLYRVSVRNSNVLMANIRKWNHLPNDHVSTGQKLIIGYLVSAEADKIHEPEETGNVVAHGDVTPPDENKKETIKEEPKKEETKKEVAAPKKEAVIPDPPKETEKKPEVVQQSTTPPQVASTDGSGGYFKSQFEQQVKTQPVKTDQTASAGIFKTASGWQDAKYYALMDGVEPGTIIRLVNPTNNKAVYAKVLGEMSGIRQNQGYDVRISNAAASAMQVSDTDKFIVRVAY
ncbi:MAG: LysM peptidoglycan-binding domain-containing protein [Flavisolibacter sp.]